MYQPDETIRLEVRMDEETVWLSQAQMAELFQRDQSVIARHIRNIYKEEELDEESTYAKFAYMGQKHRSDGSCCVREELDGESVVAKFATVQIEGGRLNQGARIAASPLTVMVCSVCA